MFASRLPFILSFLLLLTGFSALQAQQNLSALLKKLTPEQKQRALEYMRSVGSDIDRELACAFQQLSSEGQSKALLYLQSVQPQTDGKSELTTVRWSRDTVLFGVLEEGTVYIDSVKVTNTGNKPYQISGHQTACDCAVLQAPVAPLLPGESATVRIEFNSVGKAGKVRTGIVLQDNSSPNARTILYVKGAVTPKKSAKKRPWE